MNATPVLRHVLDPECGFDELSRRLDGWRVVSRSEQPILPGEPEHALFESGPGERIVYSFNPVCRLRVVEIGEHASAGTLAQLPTVDERAIAAWLDSSEEREALRGVLAARLMPSGALLQHVGKLQSHPEAAIARAARKLTDETRLAAEMVSMQAAQSATRRLEEQVRPLLLALCADDAAALSESLRPRPGDAELAFTPAAAAPAGEAFDALWRQSPRVEPVPVLGELRIYLAPAGMLAEDNPLSHRFPGGYRTIAPLLQPHRVWVHWKYLRPGRNAGMAYDGLVWLDDHWAWFPKPYRVLRALVERT